MPAGRTYVCDAGCHSAACALDTLTVFMLVVTTPFYLPQGQSHGTALTRCSKRSKHLPSGPARGVVRNRGSKIRLPELAGSSVICQMTLSHRPLSADGLWKLLQINVAVRQAGDEEMCIPCHVRASDNTSNRVPCRSTTYFRMLRSVFVPIPSSEFPKISVLAVGSLSLCNAIAPVDRFSPRK